MSSSLNQNIPPHTLSRIAKEVRNLTTATLDGIVFIPNEKDLTNIQADLIGPENTAYEGGRFRCRLIVGSDFPTSPPRGVFLTKIFHPNVSPAGEICVNTLKKDWNAELGLPHVFQVIRCLLIVPFPESALNEEASKLFLESYDEYYRRAQLLTSIHAANTSASSATAAAAASSDHTSKSDESLPKLAKTLTANESTSSVGTDGAAGAAIGSTAGSSNTTNTSSSSGSGDKTIAVLPKKTTSRNALKRL